MRCSSMALALLAASLFVAPSLRADDTTPNFSGTWQLDASKSPQAEGQNITLTIQDGSGKFDFTRVVHDRDGKETTSTFTCQAGGKECAFDESGHKAKVSLWYDGSALMILKTDGPKEDSVTQWKLQLAPDGKTLNIQFDHIEPSDKSENLVFDKKPS